MIWGFTETDGQNNTQFIAHPSRFLHTAFASRPAILTYDSSQQPNCLLFGLIHYPAQYPENIIIYDDSSNGEHPAIPQQKTSRKTIALLPHSKKPHARALAVG